MSDKAHVAEITLSIDADIKLRRLLSLIARRLKTMAETLQSLQEKVVANEATLQANGQLIDQLKASVDGTQDAVATAFNALQTQVADLKAQIADGQPIGQAALDALGEALEAQRATIAEQAVAIGDTKADVETTAIPAAE